MRTIPVANPTTWFLAQIKYKLNCKSPNKWNIQVWHTLGIYFMALSKQYGYL